MSSKDRRGLLIERPYFCNKDLDSNSNYEGSVFYNNTFKLSLDEKDVIFTKTAVDVETDSFNVGYLDPNEDLYPFIHFNWTFEEFIEFYSEGRDRDIGRCNFEYETTYNRMTNTDSLQSFGTNIGYNSDMLDFLFSLAGFEEVGESARLNDFLLNEDFLKEYYPDYKGWAKTFLREVIRFYSTKELYISKDYYTEANYVNYNRYIGYYHLDSKTDLGSFAFCAWGEIVIFAKDKKIFFKEKKWKKFFENLFIVNFVDDKKLNYTSILSLHSKIGAKFYPTYSLKNLLLSELPKVVNKRFVPIKYYGMDFYLEIGSFENKNALYVKECITGRYLAIYNRDHWLERTKHYSKLNGHPMAYEDGSPILVDEIYYSKFCKDLFMKSSDFIYPSKHAIKAYPGSKNFLLHISSYYDDKAFLNVLIAKYLEDFGFFPKTQNLRAFYNIHARNHFFATYYLFKLCDTFEEIEKNAKKGLVPKERFDVLKETHDLFLDQSSGWSFNFIPSYKYLLKKVNLDNDLLYYAEGNTVACFSKDMLLAFIDGEIQSYTNSGEILVLGYSLLTKPSMYSEASRYYTFEMIDSVDASTFYDLNLFMLMEEQESTNLEIYYPKEFQERGYITLDKGFESLFKREDDHLTLQIKKTQLKKIEDHVISCRKTLDSAIYKAFTENMDKHKLRNFEIFRRDFIDFVLQAAYVWDRELEFNQLT
jgi:hypothetical protein